MTRRLTSRLLDPGTVYRGAGGFALKVDVDDAFQGTMLTGLYDRIVVKIIERFVRPGSEVIDAGAHVGYFALRLARLVGPEGGVHAFECDPRLHPRLAAHVTLNDCPSVTVNACGLLDRTTSSTELYLPTQLGWATTLAGAWGAQEAATVSMVRLDDYVLEHGVDPARISFIKLDVEGSEVRALRGAEETLFATSAAVLVEFIPGRLRALGDDPDELLALMARAGFSAWSPAWGRRGRLVLVPGTKPDVGEDVLFLKGGHGEPAGPLARGLNPTLV